MAFKLFLIAGLMASASALCPKVEWHTCQDNQISCHMGYDIGTGCDLGSICYPNEDPACPAICPCPQDKQECPDLYADPSAACPSSPQCHDLFVKSNNWIAERGHDNDPNHKGVCPVHCPIACEQKRCTDYFDSMGCPEPDQCVAHDEECPPHINGYYGCRIITPEENSPQCGEGEQICPGTEDHMGCFGPSTCWPANEDCPASQYSGGCLVDTTPPCTADQMECYGGYDHKMCDLPKKCLDIDADAKCFLHCPAGCGPDDLICSPAADPVTGCPAPEFCKASKDPNGCPAFCPPIVDWDKQIECPGPVDPLTGCKGEAIVLDKDPVCGDPQCPDQTECRPETFGKGAMFCPGPIDSVTGCQAHGSCELPMIAHDGSLCPVVCHNHCGVEEYPCDNGMDDNGCPIANHCIPLGETCGADPIIMN